MLSEFTGLSEAAKKKGLKGQKMYYYIFFIATREDQRGKGLSSELIRKCQERARSEGVPAWLEATTENSQRLYARLGFQVVERMVLGKGVAAADGTQCKGGEGVPIWAMVWWPDESKKLES
jgi:GNAT superfamily N-acetyltransferase